jgi:hypothetical protein
LGWRRNRKCVAAYNIDEKIDYEFAYAGGHGLAVAIAVIAGPGTNGLLYPVARFGLPWWRTSSSPSIAYLAFWFLFMQLANLYDYVPIRVAASDGGVRQWIRATSPLLDCSGMTAQSRPCSSRVPHTGRHPGPGDESCWALSRPVNPERSDGS